MFFERLGAAHVATKVVVVDFEVVKRIERRDAVGKAALELAQRAADRGTIVGVAQVRRHVDAHRAQAVEQRQRHRHDRHAAVVAGRRRARARRRRVGRAPQQHVDDVDRFAEMRRALGSAAARASKQARR